MQTKMNKSDLASIIEANKVKHKESYEKAFAGFKATVEKALQTNLENIKKGKKINVYVNEAVPVDHTEDYDRALDMITHNIDSYVILNAEDYSRYVQDNWQWKQQWNTSNAKYIG